VDANSFGTWLGAGLSGAGLIVSVGGFWFAIAQIRKTKSAVEQARDAVARAERRVAASNLLVVIPQFLELEAQLSGTLSSDSEVTRLLLTRWRHLAAQVRALVQRALADETALASALRETIGLAALAGEALTPGTRGGAASVRKARLAIGRVTADVGALVITLQSYTGDDERG
jgi:hypothetical protein